MKKLLLFNLLSVFLLMSCSDDDTFDPILEDDDLLYDNGFFVLNEGAFGGAPGTVSYVDQDDLTNVEQEIYNAANPTAELGLGTVLQSIFFSGENAFVVSNGSNLITVVNRYTFEFVGEISDGLNAPRYGAVANGKAYVTNQASWQTNDDDYIAVIDLNSLEVEASLPVNAPVEYILEEEGKLYVQNASFNTGNKISIIDPQTNSITESILVGEGLNSFEIEDNILYALVGSGVKTVNLTSLEVSNLFDFSETGAFSNLEIENDRIYYTSGNKVFSVARNATEAADTPIIEATDLTVLYGFSVEDNVVYMADAGDFASESSIFMYDETGTLLEETAVGIAPNGFYFND